MYNFSILIVTLPWNVSVEIYIFSIQLAFFLSISIQLRLRLLVPLLSEVGQHQESFKSYENVSFTIITLHS